MTTFTFSARVTDVSEKRLRKHVSGAGDNAKFDPQSAGFYLHFGNFMVLVGDQKPDVTVGAEATITIEVL